MSEYLALRWVRRYKLFFLLGVLILGVQIFLAYKSLGISEFNTISSYYSTGDSSSLIDKTNKKINSYAVGVANQNSVSDDEDTLILVQSKRSVSNPTITIRSADNQLTSEQLGFHPKCNIIAKEALSALQRSKTKDCRKQIAHIACAIQAHQFYPKYLNSYCPITNHTAHTPLGCYRDKKELRLLVGYFNNLKTSNTPMQCIQLCLQSGYPYAGVQYGTECFCGVESPPNSAKLPDSSCNMKCSGDSKDVCGGYFTMNIYKTGIAKFITRIAEIHIKPETERVRIAFLLTLNGRALRQVHRLIKALYSPNHVFYIHVDSRQDYLFRKLLELEKSFPNIRLIRNRFSTIWGGASLLTMLLQCMENLLASKWHWDFVINLSESDFPIKTVDKLVDFLSANKGKNFVKSHGRETLRFIQKQGLDKTFVECDTHMWRIGDRALPAGIQVDGGSDWVALSRSFIEYIITQSKSDPLLQGLLTIFRYTLLPAESFFHTVLRNSYFCDTYIDNNLHVTNWKRKLGCKCQYKHVVDWCGCSPNDFKPEDWNRLQGTENKMLFFARKFEPIINQAIVLQLEDWVFGSSHRIDYVNVNGYWQSLYHVEDPLSIGDDLIITVGESLMRVISRKLQLRPERIQELTHYMHQDQYKGFLLRYHVTISSQNRSIELETRIRPMQFWKVAKNSKFAKRLKNFEVSSDFDQKEQVSRNFAKLLGPYSELVVSFTFVRGSALVHSDSSHSYNLTLLWIDPIGRLQDFNEIHIEDAHTDVINFSKALLKLPLTPGIWTAKLIGRSFIYAQTKFLVTPLAILSGKPIKPDESKIVNAGSDLSLPVDFVMPSEWQQHIPNLENSNVLQQLMKIDAQHTNASLLGWIDELVGKFFHMRETCEVIEKKSMKAFQLLPLCTETTWSSLALDPKSDVNTLLKPR